MNKKLYILLAAMLLVGVGILVYPYMNHIATDIEMSISVDEFEELTDTNFEKHEISDSNAERPYSKLWEDIQAYNAEIYAQGQSELQSKSDYEEPSFILADYGLESEVFAVLSIPSIDIEMPIYLGAANEHLRDGAAHLSQTSLPIGGKNTNCVIAGHRGYNGAPYFRYIDKLQIGDTVAVTNLWETLTYTVVDIQIIDPDDIEAIHIQEGREILTLLTCHPYASGGRQRYLAVCERDEM